MNDIGSRMYHKETPLHFLLSTLTEKELYKVFLHNIPTPPDLLFDFLCTEVLVVSIPCTVWKVYNFDTICNGLSHLGSIKRHHNYT